MRSTKRGRLILLLSGIQTGSDPRPRKPGFLPYSFAGRRHFSWLTPESPLEMTGSHMSDIIRFPDLSKGVTANHASKISRMGPVERTVNFRESESPILPFRGFAGRVPAGIRTVRVHPTLTYMTGRRGSKELRRSLAPAYRRLKKTYR